MEKKVSEELISLTEAYEQSRLKKLAVLRTKAFTEDYPKGSSKTGFGNPHFSLLLNGVTQRDYGMLKLAIHIEPDDMGKTGTYGVFHHVKTHKSAKLINAGEKTVERNGSFMTYFDVDPDNLEADLCKAFNGLAKKLKSIGATQTNLCNTCKKFKKGCVVNPSGPVSSCSLHDPK